MDYGYKRTDLELEADRMAVAMMLQTMDTQSTITPDVTRDWAAETGHPLEEAVCALVKRITFHTMASHNSVKVKADRDLYAYLQSVAEDRERNADNGQW